MSATLRDVAELASVSIGTASQALNGRPSVANATRLRVLDAARTLGYPIRAENAGGHSARLSTIGMLVKHDLDYPIVVNPFYSHVQAGVERECRRQRIGLMYALIEVDRSNHPMEWPALVHERQLDGLLLVGAFIENAIDFIYEKVHIPIVLLDSYAPNTDFDTVLIDNAEGTRQALEYLIGLGHRHIGLVGYNEQSPPSFQERHAEYRQTLARHGIEQHYIAASFHSTRAAYEATRQLLQQSPQVTAIFGCMDMAAIGALNAVHDMGLRVPDDISIMGFDNIDMANEIRPRLTTIHVHKTWLGIIGVRRLFERCRDPEQPKTVTRIATRLVERDSVAPPRV